MKELFVREPDEARFRAVTAVTLIAAFLLLILFAGCAPAGQAADRAAPQPTATTAVQ